MKQIVTLDQHALAQDLLAKLRNKQTRAAEFRGLLDQLTRFLIFEATSSFKTKPETIDTPVCQAEVQVLSNPLAVASIMRAGDGMLRAAIELLPEAKICHIGLYRDEKTLRPVSYYQNVPNIQSHDVIVLDPMLATGHSALAALETLQKQSPANLHLISVIASPAGVELIRNKMPDVSITVGAVDPRLNENGFIVPGLGDAGDRIFNTRQEG